MDLSQVIRNVPDFPSKGILFRDVTPLLARPEALREACERMAAPFRDARIDRVLAIESRGFLFGAPMALMLGAGFVPLRKPGKLPGATLREAYALEYGEAVLEVHADAVAPGQRVLLVDDVLATGGTLAAAASLARRLGGELAGATVLIELEGLRGRARVPGLRVESVLRC
ncbi:MAG: adenine phosphoribosyltransferase [Planctomycetia bacterium]